MRCSGWSSLAISVCSALALVAPAGAHVIAMPQFVASGSTATISLSSPNERDVPMTGFTVTAPGGFVIKHAHASGVWESTIRGSTVSWTGSSVPVGGETEFGIDLEAKREPGPAELQTEQLYPGGAIVRWPVGITVVPGAESTSQNLALVGVVGLIGLFVVAAVGAFAWRRRSAPLQER